MILSKQNISASIKSHVSLLRQIIDNDKSKFRSIYDYPVYTDIFIDDVLFFKKNVSKDAKVLDLGCGRGTSSYVLADLGLEVTGIEVEYENYDPKLTSYVFPVELQKPLWKKTVEALPDKKLGFQFYNGKVLPFKDETFDAIFAYAVLEHVDDIKETLNELNRVLKKDGILFVSRTPNKFSYSEYLARLMNVPAHDNLYTKKEMENILNDTGFNIKNIQLIDFFPSNLPLINKYYQRLSDLLLFLDKIIRYTPLKFISHHFRLIAIKNEKLS